MAKNINPNIDENGDFILRWKLDLPTKPKKSKSKDPFRDFCKDILKEFFDIVMPTYKGKDVKIDGFRFLNSIENNLLYRDQKKIKK